MFLLLIHHCHDDQPSLFSGPSGHGATQSCSFIAAHIACPGQDTPSQLRSNGRIRPKTLAQILCICIILDFQEMFSLLCLFENTENKRALDPEIPGVENPMVSEGKDEQKRVSMSMPGASHILLTIYGHQTILRHPFSLKYGPKKSKDNEHDLKKCKLYTFVSSPGLNQKDQGDTIKRLSFYL